MFAVHDQLRRLARGEAGGCGDGRGQTGGGAEIGAIAQLGMAGGRGQRRRCCKGRLRGNGVPAAGLVRMLLAQQRRCAHGIRDESDYGEPGDKSRRSHVEDAIRAIHRGQRGSFRVQFMLPREFAACSSIVRRESKT